MDYHTGLPCTNRECFLETDTYYRVVDADGNVVDFGLCWSCAWEAANLVPGHMPSHRIEREAA